MSVLERIKSGEYFVMVVSQKHEIQQSDGTLEAQLLRLAKIGAEAEKASKRCADYPIACRTITGMCKMFDVCKMVREEKE